MHRHSSYDPSYDSYLTPFIIFLSLKRHIRTLAPPCFFFPLRCKLSLLSLLSFWLIPHFHAHQPQATATSSHTPGQPEDSDTENDQDAEPGVAEGSNNCDGHGDNASDIYQSDNSELGLDERDLEGWEDVESDGGSDLDGNHGLEDEDGEELGVI